MNLEIKLHHTRLTRGVWFCYLWFMALAIPSAAQERQSPFSAPLLSDHFNATRLNTQDWVFGNHPNNHSLLQNGALVLRSAGKTSGWIHTREKFALRGCIIQLKMAQPNGDGALGISPTVTSASPIAFSAEQNFYRFYTSRDETTGPYRLFVQWSKRGVVDGLEVAPEVELKPNSYLRMLAQGEMLYFQYSFDGNNWQTAYAEVFSLPGYTLEDRFYIEIAAGYTERNGEWIVDDFVVQQNEESSGAARNVTKIILNDPLRERALGTQHGGKFAAGGGWQATGADDMLVYDLGRYVENGALEMQVRNFKPSEQNTYARHHLLAMFRNAWGNHHAVEASETFWDLHTGTMYAPGVKLQSSTNFVDEKATLIKANWKKEETYKILLVWNGKELQYFRNGALQAMHTHDGPLQLRYIFVGRDRTVSGDLVTNYKNNQYPGFVGPIFSNLIVKAHVPADDNNPPRVENVAIKSLYANAARLSWTTSERAVCLIEYGTAFDQQTPTLGPPAQSFSTTLTGLGANQTYSYRIVAMDEVDNRTTAEAGSFTTMKGGLYLFQPSADTYVEKNNIYGETRAHGNFGWMNLLASDGRECYLRFNVSSINGNVAQAALRLHGRQSGKGGGKLRLLNAEWEENDVTWLTKPVAEENDLGYIDAVHAEQWQGLPLREIVNGNGVYNFALIGSGETVSFDSRESTNHPPELLVVQSEKDASAPKISEVEINTITSTNATLTWKTNEPATAFAQYAIAGNEPRVVADTTDFAFEHVMTLRHLQPYKKYRTRVGSSDVAGNLMFAPELEFETLPARVEQVALHEVFEAHFTASNAGDSPYLNGPEITLTFTGTAGAAQGQIFKASGFWDGRNIYLARFAPPATGTWSWISQSTDAGMRGQSGALTCIGALPPEHISARGHVQRSTLYPGTFAHADSTPFFLIGAKSEGLLQMAMPSFQKYVDARVEQGYNFFQAPAFEIASLGKFDDAAKSAFVANDVDRLNPDYWRRLDERIAYANAKGMVAGLHLFPGNAFSHFLNAQQLDHFVQYLVHRYAVYNIVWVVAEDENFDRLAAIIALHDAERHAIIALPHSPSHSNESLRASTHENFSSREEAHNARRLVLGILNSAEGKAEAVREKAWESVMRGRFFVYEDILSHRTVAKEWEENLYTEAMAFIKTLKDFWTGDIHHIVPWWKFTRFEELGKAQWLAAQPGEAYAVYSESSKAFKIDVSEVRGEVRGEWFNTKTGLWSTAFSGAPSRNFALKPPGEGYAAFLWVYR